MIFNSLYIGEIPDPTTAVTNVSLLIPQLCQIYPMKNSTFKAIKFLPSFISYLKTVHGINEICHTLSLHNVKMEYSMLVETFTAKDISQFFNYDILEIYGDAFLKFFHFLFDSSLDTICVLD